VRSDGPGIAKAKRTADLLEEAVDAGEHADLVRTVLGELDALLDGGERRTIDGWGDAAHGGAILIRSDVLGAAEALQVTWNHKRIERIEIEPRHGFNFERAQAPGPVIEALIPVLWRHVRDGGALPAGVERFAGFFSARG
jgi:hypothetical protein